MHGFPADTAQENTLKIIKISLISDHEVIKKILIHF